MIKTNKIFKNGIKMLIGKYLILIEKLITSKKITEVENKMPDTSGLVNKTILRSKATRLENKITNNIFCLVKTSTLNAKMTEIENKCLILFILLIFLNLIN